jgi:hypothetical protein
VRAAVYDYQLTNSEGCVFNKLVFYSWCATADLISWRCPQFCPAQTLARRWRICCRHLAVWRFPLTPRLCQDSALSKLTVTAVTYVSWARLG